MGEYIFSNQDTEAIRTFIGHWVSIRFVRDTFAFLYEEKSSVYYLSNAANEFFGRLSDILRDYLCLAYARVLDRYDAAHSNFTIEYLFKLKEWTEPEKTTLTNLYAGIQDFKQYVWKARNKVLAHNDLKTYLGKGGPVGGFPEGKDLEFIHDVERFVDVIHKEAFGETIGEIVTSNPGDAQDLIRYLRFGLAVDRLMTDNSVEMDMSPLFAQLDMVQHEAELAGGDAKAV
jgi:hypothetical protein